MGSRDVRIDPTAVKTSARYGELTATGWKGWPGSGGPGHPSFLIDPNAAERFRVHLPDLFDRLMTRN